MASLKTTKTELAKKLGISRSSLYYKPRKPPLDEENKNKIISVMNEHPAYGARRIALALHMNRKKTKRLMRLHGFKPKIRRGFRLVKQDDLKRPETRVINILKVLCPIQPNVIWAGDFTYLWFQNRFWYVATVIDVHTREIVGWHIGNHHTTALIMEAFQDATRRTGTTPQYFHSDQGSEYVSGAYESLLERVGTILSHSRKSSPWQNGIQESFYANFKLELGDVKRFDHVGELIEAIHRQICYYNNDRIHSAHRMPPAVFRLQMENKITALVAA
jgi:transposase InsO family protein